MKFILKNISHLSLTIAMVSMVASSLHFHIEAPCTSEETRTEVISENVLDCLVCNQAVQLGTIERTNTEISIEYISIKEFIQKVKVDKDSAIHDLSRAPPFQA